MNTQFEELVRAELSSSVDGIHLAPNVFQAAMRRHRRRRAITGGLTGAAVVTAAAAVTAGVIGGTGTASHPGGTVAASQSQRHAATTPELQTVAYVRQRILQAVDPEHAIVRTTWSGDGQTNDNWLDKDTGYITDYTYDHGALSEVTHFPQYSAGDATSVDYQARTYYVVHQDAQPPAPAQTSGKLGEPWLNTVADIKAAIQRADVQILGHGVIDGRQATHLRFTYRAYDETIRGDAWFDAQTYAPLRATTTFQATMQARSDVPRANGSTPGARTGQPGPTSETTSFLPRTAANLAKTQLTIPDGFTQVPPPAK